MQKIVYFTPVPSTGKLSTIITDKSINELIALGIVPSNSKTVIEDFLPDDLDQTANLYHIELFKFNDAGTEVLLNKPIAEISILEDIRTKRGDLLAILDSLQTRALISGKSELVSEIEADKVKLRNITLSVSFEGRETLKEIWKTAPVELFVDYKAKYEPKFK